RARSRWWKNAGSATCRKIVNNGFSEAIGSCRIMAMRRPRTRRSSRWLWRVSSSPSKSTRPPTMRAARGSSPTIDRHVVVLPLPDSPTSPSVSPSFRLKLIRSTALTTREPPKPKKCVCRSETSRTGATATRVPEGRHGCAGASRTCGGLGAMSGPPSLEIPRLWIEANTQPVAEQLRGEHDEEDTEAGEHREPPLARHQRGARLREHEAPGRLGRRHAHAEEAQRGLGDDHHADGEAGQHGRRVHHVGQDVAL